MARQFTRSARGACRKTAWVAPADQAFVAVATGAKVIVASFDPGLLDPSPTIIRTRGQVSYFPNNAGADISVVGAFGVGIVSQEAFAIGITAVPGPFDSADWGGWLAWGSYSSRQEFSDTTGIFQSSWQIDVDSKGMRKVATNETLILVWESQSGAVDVLMPLRTLWKLS